jgi:hypothetical protein
LRLILSGIQPNLLTRENSSRPPTRRETGLQQNCIKAPAGGLPTGLAPEQNQKRFEAFTVEAGSGIEPLYEDLQSSA